MTHSAVFGTPAGLSTAIPWPRALVGLGVLTVGASQCPYGSAGALGLAVSLAGAGMCLFFALTFGEFHGSILSRGLKSALALIGVLFLWAGTLASATAVAGYYHARNHQTPYTAGVEILAAVLCATLGPTLLVFGGPGWTSWNNRTRAALWAYWLAFLPVSALAAAVFRPRG